MSPQNLQSHFQNLFTPFYNNFLRCLRLPLLTFFVSKYRDNQFPDLIGIVERFANRMYVCFIVINRLLSKMKFTKTWIHPFVKLNMWIIRFILERGSHFERKFKHNHNI